MLKDKCILKILHNLLWINLVVAMVFWVSDAFVDYYLFDGGSLLKEMFSPNTHHIWIYSFVFFMFAVQGFIVQLCIDHWRKVLKIQGEVECEKSLKSQAKSYSQLD